MEKQIGWEVSGTFRIVSEWSWTIRDENWMDMGYLETVSRRCSLLGCGEGKHLAGATVGVG